MAAVRAFAAAIAAMFALLPLAAEAQSFRCVGKDGKKYYGQSVPPQCLGLPVEQLNAQGMVTKRFDAAASAAEREKKVTEEEERKKREAVTKEEGRRNRALLATYTSEKDIDEARGRALKDNEAAVKDIAVRIAGLKKRQDELKKELDFFQGKNKPPAKLSDDIRNADFDIKTQEDLMAAKKKEVALINTRYDEDKKRYGELTGLDVRERASRTGQAKSLTIVTPTDSKSVTSRDQREAESRVRQDQYELQRIEAERSRGPRTTTIGPSDRGSSSSTGTRTMMCGSSRIVCDARDTVVCNGRAVPCQ
jgi:hypothetical protein